MQVYAGPKSPISFLNTISSWLQCLKRSSKSLHMLRQRMSPWLTFLRRLDSPLQVFRRSPLRHDNPLAQGLTIEPQNLWF